MSRCSVIRQPNTEDHDLPGHPECEARLKSALEGIPADARVRSAGPASIDDLSLVHDRIYISSVQERCKTLATHGYLDPDTYLTPSSFRIAAGAAGCTIAAMECSLEGEHSFAFVRPPGHHAVRNHAMGFCIFNNAAIAAATLKQRAGRIAIVDWDYHHGNGTQAAFYESGNVLYCSVHDGCAFPFTGSSCETGAGPGAGFTINAPLTAGAGIADYHLVFSDVFCPAIARFDPDALIVSAGQDILSDDPLGMMNIHPEDLEVLVRLLKNACSVPLALVLEGGYGPSHGKAVAHIFRALATNDKTAPDPDKTPLFPETAGLVTTLRTIYRL